MEADMGTVPLFVSAIIPVYNGEAFLAEAVETIRRQNYHPLEIIIVDDGSTDNTETIARGFDNEVIYVRQENRGPGAARNRGLGMASGNVIAFLDVDDLWSRDKLKIQLPLLKDSFVDIVLGYTQIMMLAGIIEGRHTFGGWSDPLLAMNLSCALFKRSVFDKVGLFDETQIYCDDWDWFMRARERNVRMLMHKEVTYYYRRHGSNMTNQPKLGNHYFIRMLKKSLDRRRQDNDSQAVSMPNLSSFGEGTAGRPSGSSDREAKD
jgi:glycosyltransferase involved in cell wall biosynthesis